MTIKEFKDFIEKNKLSEDTELVSASKRFGYTNSLFSVRNLLFDNQNKVWYEKAIDFVPMGTVRSKIVIYIE
ncbi:MAG: hypothetical protein AABY22_20460 [Nanoarchaeota archaeon]